MTSSLDVVIPVLNEERDLPPNVGKLNEFLAKEFSSYRWRIIIADNGSTDSTPEVSRHLSQKYPNVEYLRLEQRGRGLAMRTAWTKSDADIVSYTDVDLSTDISALVPMVRAIEHEGYDIAIGSRLRKGSEVHGRGLKREVFSRGYSHLFRTMFFTGFRDAQCGFKAFSRRVINDVLPLVKDQRFFFDTELLVIAEKNGYRVKEVPVKWTDDPDSRVNVWRTAYEDFKGLLRMRFGGLREASRELRRQRQ